MRAPILARKACGLAAGLALGILALGTVAPAPATAAGATDNDFANYRAGSKYSGYVIADPTTREMQDDDFVNPAFLWVEKAEALWTVKDGAAGKSCADCHNDVSSLKGAATHYPQVDAETGKLMNVELRINDCRERRMQAKPWKYASDEMAGMTALVKMQSRGMPLAVDVSGANEAWFKKGEALYNQRIGSFDIACSTCHETLETYNMRSELLSQGHVNGFPTYRLKWQKLGSLHMRFQECNNNIRAEPLEAGHEDYLALEMYVTHRGNGLPIESPSVRK